MTLVAFENIHIDEQREPMVLLADFPFISVPVYYNNGWAKTPDMFLRQQLAEKLLLIQEKLLAPKGLGWIIFDAYRDRRVQANIYQYYWNKFSRDNSGWSQDQVRDKTGTFVTMPIKIERIPPHSTGGSVDLGLYNSNTNQIVPMGPDFDEFSDEVRTDYYEQAGRDKHVRDMRRLMNSVLIAHGIVSDEDEYFHKDWGNQKWAAHANQTCALYGEIISCEMIGGKVVSAFGLDVDLAEQKNGIQRIADDLRLVHPSPCSVKPLPLPAKLVMELLSRTKK